MTSTPAHLFEDQYTTSTNKGIRISLPLVSLHDVSWRCLVRFLSDERQHKALDHLRPPGDHEWPWHLFKGEIFPTADELYLAFLNCGKGVAIILMKLEDRHQFVRVYPHVLLRLDPKELKPKRVYVRQDVRLAPKHQSTAIAALTVHYHDYVNYDSGKSRKILANSHWETVGTSGRIANPDDIGRMLFRKDGAENTFRFGYYGDEPGNDLFTFSLKIQSLYGECVEITDEFRRLCRLRNMGEQKKYDAPFAVDEDPDFWYNRWAGSVHVIFKFHRVKGVYEVCVFHDVTGQMANPDFEIGASRDHPNFGETIRLATLGHSNAQISVQAHTRWDGRNAVVSLVIREFIAKTARTDKEAELNRLRQEVENLVSQHEQR